MLQAKNISHSYKLANKNSVDILSEINFTLPNNGVVFIVGKSGCGKTTLLNILEGILKPSSGQVLFDNIDIYDNKKFDFNSHIGILFQNYNLIDDLSVYENLLIGAELKNVDKKLIDEKLAEFNLSEFKNQNVDDLSGGEKQRVSFIRSILNSPDILFCDEPTGAIDEDNAKILMKNIREIATKSLVVIVTHNRELIEENDFVIEINQGKVNEKLPILENNPVKVHSFSKNKKKHIRSQNLLIARLFRKSTFKHVLFIISMLFSILFISLTLSLSFGIKNLENNLEFSYLNYNKFTISKREKKMETDGPISLTKEIRPTKEEISKELNGSSEDKIYNNYSYFLNGNNIVYSGKNEIKNVRIELSFNLINEIAVNNLFYDLIDKKDDKISLELNQKYTYNYIIDEATSRTYDEDFYYHKMFNIQNVVNEFKYLNTPTIYLPFFEFEAFMKQYNLKNVLLNEKKQINWYEVISKANPDDPITSFSYDLYLENKNNIVGAYGFIDSLNENSTLKISNNAHFYASSFLNITNILVLGLNLFCGLSGIITLCLLFFIVVSLYLSEKKEIAILKVLGSRPSDIRNLFNNTMVYETILSVFMGIVFSLLISKIINKIVASKLAIYNLFASPNFGINLDFTLIILIVILVSVLLVMLVNYLAIYKATKSSIATELREE